MPTGYTAGVQSGKVTDFSEFAMQCARAFGALIMMRDEPSSAEIPERFEPSNFNLKRKAEAEAELKRLEVMTDEEIKVARDVAEAKRIADRTNYNDTKAEQKERYEAMLAKVDCWVPPTVDHAEMKKFMRDQLIESIDFDCSPSTWDEDPLPPAEDWHKNQVNKAHQDITYYEEKHNEEVARTESRNEWLRQLRESLA